MADRARPSEPLIVFVGTLVPDEPRFRGPAFGPSGNLFQLNFMNGLVAAGTPPITILSQRPQRAFPRGSAVWQEGGVAGVPGGLEVRLVPYLNLPILRPLTVGISVVAAILGIAKREGSDRLMLCTYNLSEPPGLFTLLAARLAGAKAVAFMCDVNVPGGLVPNSWSRRTDFKLQQWLMPRFDGLIVISERIASDFAPNVPHIRVEGGVSERMLAVARRRTRHRSPNRFTMIAAGSLNEANGIREILGAMRLLSSPHYRLRIAGSGPLEGLVREAMAEDPRIEYCGLLSFEDVLSLYADGDALLNIRLTKRIDTSYYFPGKTMELLASGAPVITTCPGNVREELSDLAYLVIDETAQGLAQVIESVSQLPCAERESRGSAAHAFVAKHRTWLAQSTRVIEFLRGLMT